VLQDKGHFINRGAGKRECIRWACRVGAREKGGKGKIGDRRQKKRWALSIIARDKTRHSDHRRKLSRQGEQELGGPDWINQEGSKVRRHSWGWIPINPQKKKKWGTAAGSNENWQKRGQGGPRQQDRYLGEET